jgi:hypothetical protein
MLTFFVGNPLLIFMITNRAVTKRVIKSITNGAINRIKGKLLGLVNIKKIGRII